MRIRRPDYYDRFACLAGACPDTCCAAWDVVVDPESEARFRSIPGALGERVQNALTVDQDGDTCLMLADGFCPLLTEDKLCTLHLEFGPEGPCEVCRSHPRFIEEYGPLREESLACSCPGAVRLMLADPAPARFPVVETGEPDEVCDDVDLPLLEALLPCREKLFGILQDRSRPLGVRLAEAAAWAWALQDRLDMGDWEDLAETPLPSSPEPSSEEERLDTTRALFALLEGAELLSPEWTALLRSARETLEHLSPAGHAARWNTFRAAVADRTWEFEHLAVYLVYRWLLKADFDGDLYGRAAFALFAVLAVWELGAIRFHDAGAFTHADMEELARLWCKEQEHCEENLALLARAAYEVPELAPGRLAGVLTAL